MQLGLSDQWNAKCLTDEAYRRRFGLLNRTDLQQLVDRGMSIGSHTLNHPMLSQQTSELAWSEISESRSL